MGHHTPSALACWVSAFCTYSAGMWDLTRWFCRARSCCVPYVLLGAGLSLRALALCESSWELVDPVFYWEQVHVMGLSPTGS